LSTIVRLKAREILDSRGRPTVHASCQTATGLGEASVPSGASTGGAEAVELRDQDPARYRGLGCRRAVANINGEIHEALEGLQVSSQADLDARLIALDNTTDKSRLGANAILAVSIAFARAAAAERESPLWQYFAGLVDLNPPTLPRLTINLFSGGKHAGEQVPVQDTLIVPLSSTTVDETLVIAYDIYQAAAELTRSRYSMRLLRADEGGLAPPFRKVEEMLETAVESIARAGYRPGKDVALAIDVAASHFYRDGLYWLGETGLPAEAMIAQLVQWTSSYPIISIEDGLAEEDWEHWPSLLKALGSQVLVVGDDLLCTQADRIRKAIDSSAANALLLKVNQVGTLSEAGEALRLARSAGWGVVLSVRSGETEDHWAADLAVGWGADQFKNGSITQSERLAKLNRLLEIEQVTRLPLSRIDISRCLQRLADT
jgi:enolase